MGKLVLIRHGQSVWNLQNVFTGWVDVPLSENGIKEAQAAAETLAAIDFDVAFTSKLERARQTLNIILSKQKRMGIFLHDDAKEKKWSLHPEEVASDEIPVYSSNAINERYYGELQGLNKDETKAKHGEEQVHLWRRSYDVPPPNGECLKDTCARAIPYFTKEIMPHLAAGKNVIVAAHGNSLRGIFKHIENISDADIPNLELETGKPYIFDFVDGKLVREQ